MLRLIPILLLICFASSAAENTKPFHYSYYLFEDSAKVEGCSDCYIPLLVAREPLDGLTKQEVAVIVTYERDSIWSFRNKLAVVEPQEKNDIQARKIRFEGKVYRCQLVSNDETLRLLKNPMGTIPIHRPAPAALDKSDPNALLEKLGQPAEKGPDLKETLLKNLAALPSTNRDEK